MLENLILKHCDFLYVLGSLILLVYIFEWIRYSYKINRYVNGKFINIGQITILGKLKDIISPEQIALALRSEFSSIKQCLETMGRDQLNSSPAQASSVDYYFFFSGSKDNSAVTRQIAAIPKIEGLENKPILQTNITLELGSIKIPVSDIARSLIAFVGLLPVLPRKRYNNSLINISLISYDKKVKIVVHRTGAGEFEFKDILSVTSVASFNNIDELNLMIRDLAFMVLDLHNSFGECYWKSMRYLLDGFNEFCKFRNTGLMEDRNNAMDLFYSAMVTDPENNLEALFYYSVMLMTNRTTDAIEKSINNFQSALRTKDKKLRALINLGLAFCYAQSYHRLGRRNEQTLEQATDALEDSKSYWDNKKIPLKLSAIPKLLRAGKKEDVEKGEDFELPLIPYMKAMILFVTAAHVKEKEEKETILNNALAFANKSASLDPRNSMFANNIGWALMKLAENGIEQLSDGVLNERDERSTVLLAESFMQKALFLNPKNKLTHANLCLLYSMDHFKEQNKNDPHDLNYLRSRFHGQKAISVDPNYINGYRDLCVAYIRFGKEDLAEEYFHKALELAEYPRKDAEIFNDIIKEAEKNKIPKKVIKKWSIPRPDLFEPHEI